MSRQGDTIVFDQTPVYVQSWASCVGKKEGEGPLGRYFDEVGQDNYFGEKTWEKAESTMFKRAMGMAVNKKDLRLSDIDVALGGDLLNQCIATSFGLRGSTIPFLGLYGACSTMAESLILGSALTSGGFAQRALCTACSHFCSAERQYRYPLEYGGQRAPTTQWTATACGAVLVGAEQSNIRVTKAQIGRIYDPGVTDATNMGAAMAQSAFETISQYFRDTGTKPCDYSLIVTGDLATIGKQLVLELFAREGQEDIKAVYDDCGLMLFSGDQDVHAGASGCGCSAAVLCAYILRELDQGTLSKVLFCGTGALLSPTSTNQGETVPGICHLVCLESEVK